ncbi:hypothetical protein D3C81_2333520 [compost metagenome]
MGAMILFQLIASRLGDDIALLHIGALLHADAGQALIDSDQPVGMGDLHLIAYQGILFDQRHLAA